MAESMDEALATMEDQLGRLDATPSILPASGVVTSRYSGNRAHPLFDRVVAHPGIDVSAPRGTPIVAAANGVIRSAGWKQGYGYTVVIDHGYGFTTLYAHASKVLARAGQTVKRGAVVAQVGSTGISTGTHLHYEVHLNGRRVNPLNYVLGRIQP